MSRMASSLSWLFRGWWVLPCFIAAIRRARCGEVPLVSQWVIVVRQYFGPHGRPCCFEAINGVRAVVPGKGLGHWEA